MKTATALTHDECVYLLATSADEQLSVLEVTAVVAHIEQCRLCGADLSSASAAQPQLIYDRYAEQQRERLAALQTPACEQANFDRLWQRIEIEANRPHAISSRAISPRVMRARWWLPLSAAAALLLAVALQWSTPQPVVYRTLANIPVRSVCGQLRVRFIDELKTQDLQQLLHAVDAAIVDGPSAHGVYTLRATAPSAALQQLRLHPAVVLAEPTSC